MRSPDGDSHLLQLAAFLPETRANGPGVRAAVWVQGCARDCVGCFNRDFAPLDGGSLVDPAELAAAIAALPDIDGLTLSGGEPFRQASAAAVLARAVREAGLSVLVYTGYLHEELQDSPDSGMAELLASTDILIDGPFVEALAEGQALKGSSNQRVIALTPRGAEELASHTAEGAFTELDIAGPSALATGDVDSEALARVRELLSELYGVEL